MKFSDLRLIEPIQRALVEERYDIATPIQAKSIPLVLEGRDVLGCAQTGTGKTAAFALPILQRLHAEGKPHNKGRAPRCLVLCPTRELATQIADGFRAYGRHLKLTTTVIFGGVGQNPQVDALRRGVDIVIATPGRLLDLLNQRHISLGSIETLVLDEADRMLDMGFIHDIRKITAILPRQRQTLFFSATMPPEIRRLADTILHKPAEVTVAPVASVAANIDESVYFVAKADKPALLAALFDELAMARTIVFTRTKHGADRVVKQLHRFGIRAEAIHGNKSQNARQRALDNFKSGKLPMLVATDIASRGIDVDMITHVVNFDLTHEPETYVHRIGRTARAGQSGMAVSFCDHEERGNLKDIERLIKRQIKVIRDLPMLPKAKGEPIAERGPKPAHRGGSRHGGGGGNPAPKRQRAEPTHSVGGGARPTSHGHPPKRDSAPAGASHTHRPAAAAKPHSGPKAGGHPSGHRGGGDRSAAPRPLGGRHQRGGRKR